MWNYKRVDEGNKKASLLVCNLNKGWVWVPHPCHMEFIFASCQQQAQQPPRSTLQTMLSWTAWTQEVKAFLALKPLYCDQSTKLTQLIKPNYFVILLYWYNTSFLRKLPHLFLRESLVLILCSCLLLYQNISMFWCFFPLNDLQSFFCMNL